MTAVGLAWSGSSPVALSASGQAYEVPARLAAPTSRFASHATGASSGFGRLGRQLGSLDNDCSLMRLVAHSPPSMDWRWSCSVMLVHAMQAGESVLAQTTDAGLQVLGASPGRVVSAHAAADGGWWLVTATGAGW